MKVPTTAKWILVLAWIFLSMSYYCTKYYNGIFRYPEEKWQTYYNNSDDFLINTPGCTIPNYTRTIHMMEAKNFGGSCGQRAVFVKKISDEKIQLTIDDIKLRSYLTDKISKYYCCYKFVSPGNTSGTADYRKIRYSSCITFKNGTISHLNEEVIKVDCVQKLSKKLSVFYEDSYMILKKINQSIISGENNRWNILLIGMDTMSRARMSISMPKTMKYLQSQGWLDFKGYQKVGSNTLPNVASFLSGKEFPTVENACISGMDGCNKLFLWSDVKDSGYATVYGEDFISLPDTFTRYNGYKNKPTDHYMRPLFLTGERFRGNLVCTNKLTSTKHIFDYANMFTEAYQDNGFFGLFWMNSFSHNPNNNPALLEHDIIDFFETLNKTGVMENTFIFFLSDHGIRFDRMRIQYESYYDERLPMLFLWVPRKFRKLHNVAYENLKINQKRLMTPYDLYLTMWNIYSTDKAFAQQKYSEACPKCESLFKEVSPYRTCTEVGVNEKWCSCHNMVKMDHHNQSAQRSVSVLVEYLQNRSKYIKTHKCTECEQLKLKTLHRVHTYENNNKKYYVVAVLMSPGDIGFESTVVEDGGSWYILQPTYTITKYNTRGGCVINPIDRVYCVCKNIECKNH